MLRSKKVHKYIIYIYIYIPKSICDLSMRFARHVNDSIALDLRVGRQAAKGNLVVGLTNSTTSVCVPMCFVDLELHSSASTGEAVRSFC